MSTKLSYEDAMSTNYKKDIQDLHNKLQNSHSQDNWRQNHITVEGIVEEIKTYGKLNYEAGTHEKDADWLERAEMINKQLGKIILLLNMC